MALNEFRQDLVSGEWVLFATGRKHRPMANGNDTVAAARSCPFDDLSGQELVWTQGEISVIKNKYPAVQPGVCTPLFTVGPFNMHQGTGSHDVFVYREHKVPFSDFSKAQFVNVIQAYKRRYREIAQVGDCTKYIHIFHNYGRDAGASIEHPHSQIISTPIIPPDIYRSLHGAHRFFQEHGKRVYDVMIEWEQQQGKRVVYENDFFIAFCPFASRYPYEVRIFAKDGHAHFEKMPDPLDPYLADALRTVLGQIKHALGDPSYNFFIHTTPIETTPNNLHEYYAWHVEILPKVKIDAGVEIGTGFGVNSIDPDEAAQELKAAHA